MRSRVQNTVQYLAKPNHLRVLFTLIVSFLLVYQITKLDLNRGFIKSLIQEIHLFYLITAILLVFPNYYFEIKKWEILANQVEKRNFKTATNEVLRGLKLGILTPLMIGDFVGRSLDFKKENKGSAVALNLFNSIIQTWVSMFLGSLGLTLWWNIAEPALKKTLFIPTIVLSAATLAGFVLIFEVKLNFFARFKIVRKYFTEYQLSRVIKVKIIFLTILRNLLYIVQYIFFYLAFSVVLKPVIYFIGVNILLMIKTIGGGLNIFGDLSIRELVSIHFFNQFDIDPRIVLIATFVVWVVNIFIPILFGIFFKPEK